MSEKNKIKGNMMSKQFKQLEKRVKKLEEKIGSNIWVNFDEISIGKICMTILMNIINIMT